MPLPQSIPPGSRLVVRTAEGVDGDDGRMKFRDYIGHLVSWDGRTMVLNRDASANGSRPAQVVELPAERIVRIKPIPERSYPLGRHDESRPAGNRARP